MSIDFDDSGPKLSEQKLSKFETKIAYRLPEDYRKFMLRQNGGTPVMEMMFSFQESGKNSDSVIDSFYAIAAEADVTTISEAVETYIVSGRIPSSLLPIADDQFGNQLCIDVSGETRGAVYFWNHERESSVHDTSLVFPLSLISGSFDHFLGLLVPVEE